MTLAQNLQRALMGGRVDEIQLALNAQYVADEDASKILPYLKAEDFYRASDAGNYAPAVTRAIADLNGPGDIVLPNRVESYNTAINIPSNVTIRGGGSASEMVKGGTINLFNATGTHGTKTNLTTNILAGQATVTLPIGSGAAFAIGDLVGFESTTIVYGAAGRTRDIRKVTRVVGDVLSLDMPLLFDVLTSASGQFWKVTPVKSISLQDFLVSNENPESNTGYTLRATALDNLTLEHITLQDAGGGFQLYDVLGAHLGALTIDGLRNGHQFNVGSPAYGYGINLAGATSLVVVHDIVAHNCRHVLTTLTDNTRGDSTLWGGPRDCLVSDSVGSGSSTSLAIWDSHEYGSRITFDNVIGEGVAAGHAIFQIRALDVMLNNCRGYRSKGRAVRVDPLAQRTMIQGGEFAYCDEDGASSAISLSGHDATITGANIHHNGGSGVTLGNGVQRPTVTLNYIHNNGQAVVARGVVDSGAVNPLILNNIIPFGESTKQKTAIMTLGATGFAKDNICFGYSQDSEVFFNANAAARFQQNATDTAQLRIVTNVNYAMGPYDRVVRVTTSNTVRTITLPSAASLKGERVIIIKDDAGTGTITVDGNGASINGSSTRSIAATQYQQLSLISDGTNWFVL